MFFFFDDDSKNTKMAEYSEQTFENIKQYTEDGQEFWYARDLQHVLEYAEWRNFLNVVNKAKTAALNSGLTPDDDFVDVTKSWRPVQHIKILAI